MSALEQRISAQEEAILLDGEERPAHVEDHGGGHRVMLSGLPGAMPSPPQRVSSDEILGDGDGNGSTNSNHGDGSSPSGQRGSREAGAAIAALLKAGYTLGQRAMDFWARVDTNPQVAQARASFKEGLDVVRAKVQEVDEQHAISARVRAFNEEHEIAERASAAWSSAVSTAAPIASSAAEAVKAGAGELGQRAQLAGAELYMKAGPIRMWALRFIRSPRGGTRAVVGRRRRGRRRWRRAAAMATTARGWRRGQCTIVICKRFAVVCVSITTAIIHSQIRTFSRRIAAPRVELVKLLLDRRRPLVAIPHREPRTLRP